MTAIATKLTTSQRRILILLVISGFINYIDRGNLSVAAPMLTKELSLGPAQMGVLLSSFFWTYAAFQIIAGWAVDRYNVYWVYGLGYFVWSLATAATGWVGGFSSLLTLRLILGFGESVAYPAYSKILAGSFPEYHRGIANALIDGGTKGGPALGTLVGGLLMARFGWRVFFIALGLGSLLWLLPWALWTPRRAEGQGPRQAHDGPSFVDILRRRSPWGTFLALFCCNYFWYFLLTWLPSYLVMERHFSMQAMAMFGSLPFWGIGLTSVAGGWASDRLVARGFSPTLVRKGFACTGMLSGILVLPAAIIQDQTVAMAFLYVGCLGFGLLSSNVWAITQSIAGPQAAGRWTGLQNCVGNLAGVAAPAITGWVVAKTGQFYMAFVVVAVMLLLGICSYVFLVGPVRPLDWPKRQG